MTITINLWDIFFLLSGYSIISNLLPDQFKEELGIIVLGICQFLWTIAWIFIVFVFGYHLKMV